MKNISAQQITDAVRDVHEANCVLPQDVGGRWSIAAPAKSGRCSGGSDLMAENYQIAELENVLCQELYVSLETGRSSH